MSNRFRLITGAAAVAAVAVIVVTVVLTGSDDSGSTSTAGTQERPATIRIVVNGGEIRGGLPHETVKQGSKVVIRVSADVSDEVHLHGYDIARDVAPGKPAVIAFAADLPGRFEVELEGQGQQLLDLKVEP